MTSPLLQLKFLHLEPHRPQKVGSLRERFPLIEPTIEQVAKKDRVAIAKLLSKDLTTFFCFDSGGSLKVHWDFGELEVLYDSFLDFCHVQVALLRKQLVALGNAPDLLSFQIKTKDGKLDRHDCPGTLFGALENNRRLSLPKRATNDGKCLVRIK